MNFWKMLSGAPTGARPAPIPPAPLPAQPATPPESPPVTFASEPPIVHLLPLKWSLSYALTQKQWHEVRTRFKAYFPDWERCKKCPKGCPANTLDEHWKYDHDAFTKIFLGAEYICPGCHWLKTPPWRIESWLKQQHGLLRPKTKPDHIIDCLGWTQAKVDELRRNDLADHQHQQAAHVKLQTQLKQGQATIALAPMQQMPPPERDALLASGKTVIVPWRVDLSALAEYGYTPETIAVFEMRMYHVAAKRMATEQ